MPRRWRFILSCGLAGINAVLLIAARLAARRDSSPYAFGALLILVSIFCIVEATLVDEVPRGRSNLAGLASLTGIGVLATFVLAIVTEGHTANDSLHIVGGAAVMTIGIALRCAAIYTLGPRFVSELRVSDDEPLVTDGVYRWLAHPSEIGLLVASAGSALLLRSVSAFLFWAIFVLPLTILRVRTENAFLRGSHVQ